MGACNKLPAQAEPPSSRGTRTPVLPSSLAFHQSHTGHFHAAFCTHLHSAQLTVCDTTRSHPIDTSCTHPKYICANQELCLQRHLFRLHRYNLSMHHMCRCFFASVQHALAVQSTQVSNSTYKDQTIILNYLFFVPDGPHETQRAV